MKQSSHLYSIHQNQFMQELFSVSILFFKLGFISFGGPTAHVALIEQEVVHKRRWISNEQFLDIMAVTNLIPGPNAVEMASHIGYLRAGCLGLIAAGMAFIFPAFLISLALSWIYVQYGSLPQGKALFYGINPIIMAIILTATLRLGKTTFKEKKQFFIGIAAFFAALIGGNEAIILLSSGIIGLLLFNPPKWMQRQHKSIFFLPWVSFALHTQHSWVWIDERLCSLGLFFLKVGSLLFGSGMVLYAFIQRDVVNVYGWLTPQQLMDAIAVGQMTPGPVLSSVTFIGYLVEGWLGAVVATIAVFFPSFIITAVVSPIMVHLRKIAAAQAFLKGANTAVVALILVVGMRLFNTAIVDIWAGLILISGLILQLRSHIDSRWLILGGAIIGIIHYLSGLP